MGSHKSRVHREIALQGALFGHGRVVEQLHWGGGAPTVIAEDEMRALMAVTRRHFTLRGETGRVFDRRGACRRYVRHSRLHTAMAYTRGGALMPRPV